MPRHSAAELAASPAPQIPGHGRPEPPQHLDELEQAIWREVVDALPPYWIDGSGQLVLRRLVAQAAIAERCEARLRQLRGRDQDGTEDAEGLAVRHAATAKTVTYLLTALRGTPRSRDIARKAGPAVDKVPAFRPWEQRADDDVDGAPGLTQ
jgi:hypothetical protein